MTYHHRDGAHGVHIAGKAVHPFRGRVRPGHILDAVKPATEGIHVNGTIGQKPGFSRVGVVLARFVGRKGDGVQQAQIGQAPHLDLFGELVVNFLERPGSGRKRRPSGQSPEDDRSAAPLVAEASFEET